MDCKTARLLIDFARPRELEPSEAAVLEDHLASCGDCDTLARAERHLDEHIGRAVRAVAVPEGLHQRLLGRLEADSRQRRRRLLAWSAAAAALLLSAGIGLSIWRSGPPPDLDVERLRSMSSNREWIEDTFSERLGRSIAIPKQFDYAWLVRSGLEKVQNNDVPYLIFVQGEHWACVYVIDGKQFNLDSLRRNAPENSGGQTVEVLDDEEHPQFAYLVIYTGDSLQRFLNRAQRQNNVGSAPARVLRAS